MYKPVMENSGNQDQESLKEEPTENFQNIPGTSRCEMNEVICPRCAVTPNLVKFNIKVKSEPVDQVDPVEPVDPVETSGPVEVCKKLLGVIDENHIETLKRLTIVQRSFACDFCGTTCDRADHLEYQNWWTPIDVDEFQCYLCFERFSDLETFQTHESGHIVINNGY